MKITAEQIANLRSATGAGMMDCKKALEVSNGNLEEAKTYLRKKGLADINERHSKTAHDGHVGYYIHAGGKIGVLVEVNCETDFVSKNTEFQTFVRDVAMQVAAARPRWVSRDEVPQDVITAEKDIASVGLDNKPANVVDKIVDGRLNKFYKETCLLEQTYIKDQNLTISDLLGEVGSKVGEKVVIRRFSRFEVGEGL